MSWVHPAAEHRQFRLESGDPLVGHINTDDVQQLERDELGSLLGALTPTTLMRVNEALRLVFALP